MIFKKYIINMIILLSCRSLKAAVDENADLCEKAMKVIKVFLFLFFNFSL